MVAETNDEVHSYCEKPLASRIIEGVEYAVPVDNFKDLCCPPPPVQEVSSKRAQKRAAAREKMAAKFKQQKEQKKLEKRRKLEGQNDVGDAKNDVLIPETIDAPSSEPIIEPTNDAAVYSDTKNDEAKVSNEGVDNTSAQESGSKPGSTPKSEAERIENAERKKAMRVSWKEGFLERCKRNPKVVIDLEFGNVMRREEIASLTQQVMYCYGANKRAEQPVDLVLTGLEGTTLSRLRNIDGFEDWACTKETKRYAEMFPKKDLVYLTADSDDVIEELNPNDVYIIGGIVDRNRLKNCTFRKAQKQGIRTAKLPIAEHVTMSATKVLTVNCVLDIMCKQLHYKDWKKTFQECLPGRKNAEVDEVEPEE